MGKLVNVVLPNGKVVSVPEEVANQLNKNDVAHVESLAEASGRAVTNINTERSSGVVEGIKAAAEGFADAATIGGYGQLKALVSPEDARNAQIRAQERPGARLLGELTAIASPTGILGKGAAAVGGALPLSIAGNAVKNRLAQGAVYGTAASISGANVTGDPLSIEAVVADAGIGALVNFGIGKISDGLFGLGKKANAQLAAEAKQVKAANVFETTPESYNELVAAHRATVQTNKTAIKNWEKAQEAYSGEFSKLASNPKELRGIIANVDVVERKILNQLNKGKRMMEFPLKSQPGNYALELTEGERALLTRARKMLSDARVEATKSFNNGDYNSVIHKMSGTLDDVRQLLPEANLPTLPNLSKLGNRPALINEVKLPNNLKAFAKLHPDTIAKLANTVEPGSPLAAAIDKLTTDLGLELNSLASATLAGTHSTLSNMVSSAVKREATGSSILDMLRLNSKRAVRYGFGRVADKEIGGGFAGASARTIVGGMTGYALDGTEGAIIGASLVNSKSNVRSTMTNIFAKYGQGASNVVSKLGPVTSFLSVSFPSGEEDKEKDIRQLALNRVDELRAVASVANDASFSAVQPLLDMPGDIAYKIHSTLLNGVTTMLGFAPRDPGLATNMFNSYWKPTHAEALRLASAMEAVLSPMQSIQRLINGDGDITAADALWSIWPEHMAEAATELANNAQYLNNLTREQSSALGRLFRVPLNGFQQPEVIAQLQSYFLPKPPESNGPPPSKMPTGNPSGRPAAVTSPNPNQSRVSQLQR
jgi:hypothetical protein